MTSRWRSELLVNFSARSVSAIPDLKILASSLVRRQLAIASAFFFPVVRRRDTPFPCGAFRLVRVSDTEIRGGVRAQEVSIEMETNDRNPRVFPYRAYIFRGLPYFRLERVAVYWNDKGRIHEGDSRKSSVYLENQMIYRSSDLISLYDAKMKTHSENVKFLI